MRKVKSRAGSVEFAWKHCMHIQVSYANSVRDSDARIYHIAIHTPQARGIGCPIYTSEQPDKHFVCVLLYQIMLQLLTRQPRARHAEKILEPARKLCAQSAVVALCHGTDYGYS